MCTGELVTTAGHTEMLAAPEIEPHWALFLDLDGTLFDIAPTPQTVVIPAELGDTIGRLQGALKGALAVASGRTLQDVDRLLAPIKLPGVAEHGAVIRYPSGVIDALGASRRPPSEWIEHLRNETRDWDGVLIEEKTYSVAVHYRLAPGREHAVRELTRSVVQTAPAKFELLAGRMAFEIRPRNVTKARCVTALMELAPFQQRLPVFVGDDVTDQDGMEKAHSLGGIGLNVATAFGGKPSAVREWLRRAADTLG